MIARIVIYTVLALAVIAMAMTPRINKMFRAPPEVRVEVAAGSQELPYGRFRGQLGTFDLTGLLVEPEKILFGGPEPDGIPSLNRPLRVAVSEADDSLFDQHTRVAQVVVDDLAVAYPLPILNQHEIANDVVGEVPVAVTYCPLCDSVAVFDRRIPVKQGSEEMKTLEFGVSGLLLNSNVLMFDRIDRGLWSQGMMQAISGPHAGYLLETLPVQVTTLGEFRQSFPDGEILSTQQHGWRRDYSHDPYTARGYFEVERLWFPVTDMGHELPSKALGLGILAGEEAIFVPRADQKVGSTISIKTKLGTVKLAITDAGMFVNQAPDGVRTMQTFYFAWSAFRPQTTVIHP